MDQGPANKQFIMPVKAILVYYNAEYETFRQPGLCLDPAGKTYSSLTDLEL